jgi:hypothetical protein
MKLARIACPAVLIGFAALSAGSAKAAPAVATTTVNLRQGPGTTYPVVAKIPGGSMIDVAGCSGEWCQASFAGRSGYVIATALGQGGPPPPGLPPPGYVPPPPPPIYVGPPGYYGPYYGGYWGPGCCWRGGWGRRW